MVLSALLSALRRGPPRIWDPTTHTIAGWTRRFNEVWRSHGFGAAYNKLRIESAMRGDGTLVGTDANGNRYFENKSAPSGARARAPAAGSRG